MKKSSPGTPPNTSDKPEVRSYFVFGMDVNGDLVLDISWGKNLDDTKEFAYLLSLVTTGKLNDVIIDTLKEKYGTTASCLKRVSIVEKTLNNDGQKLVVDPTNVEI